MKVVETLLANPEFAQMVRNAVGNYAGAIGFTTPRKLDAPEQNLCFTMTVHDPHYTSGFGGYSSVTIKIPSDALREALGAHLLKGG